MPVIDVFIDYFLLMKFYRFLPGFVLSFVIISCSRDNEEMFLPVAEIKIYAPLVNSVVHPGDTIYIDGVAILQTGVHGYELAIRKPGGANLYFQHLHQHSDSLIIKDNWKNTLTEPGDLELWISIIVDDEDHRNNMMIPLHVGN